jgi:hypothetical protein
MFLDDEDLPQELSGLQDFVGDIAQHLLKTAMLFARPRAEEDVVEQQLLHHRGHHPIDLSPRQVHQDGGKLPDLGMDAQGHRTPGGARNSTSRPHRDPSVTFVS